MIKFSLKSFLILFCLTLASCSFLKKNDSKKVRIVDLQGKSHGVKTRVPELNARILRSQGVTPQDGDFFAASDIKNNQNENFDFNGNVSSGNGDALKNKYAADETAVQFNVQDGNANLENNIVPPTKIIDESAQSKVKAGNIVRKSETTEVEYDLSDDKDLRQSPKKTSVIGKYKISSIKNLKGIFVQTGAFSTMGNAKTSASSMNKYAKVQIEESSIGGKKIYRVLLGSFPNKTKAQAVIKKIKSDGHDAIIVKK